MKTKFKETLKDEALKNNIILSDSMLDKFVLYKEMLLDYNEKVNLTAITDDFEIIMKHFVDSLEVVKYIEKGQSVIDVGTGAGFPGVVIAIYFEGDVKVTLLDALNKRVTFLDNLINKLKLINVIAVHARAEEIAHNKDFRGKYDVAVSRAVAKLSVLIEFDIGFINKRGKCLLLKGSDIHDEIQEATNALNILSSSITNIYNYNYYINEQYNRSIVEIKRTDEIRNNYPRSYGKIKNSPL